MTREIEEFKKYAYEGIGAFFSDDQSMLEKTMKPRGWEFKTLDTSKFKIDGPDFLIISEEKVFLMEHFEFNASSFRNKKGLESNFEIGRIDRDFEKFRNENKEKNQLVQHNQINACFMYDNYIKNLKCLFIEHHNRIDDYKQNIVELELVNEKQTLVVCFFIVDSTPLGNYCYDGDNKPKAFNLFETGAFVDFLKNLKPCKVEYIFSGYFNGRFNRLVFASMANLMNDEKMQYVFLDINENTYFTFSNPQTSSFCVKA